MRRSPVKVGAVCAAILLSSIAYAQQPNASSPTYLPQTAKEASCREQPPDTTQDKTQAPKPDSQQTPNPATWTLFIVAVPYNGPWTITAVAAFSNNKKDNPQGNGNDRDNKKDNPKGNNDNNDRDSTKDNNKNTAEDNAKDVACHQCFNALTRLNNGNPRYHIPGLHREVAEAGNAEGTAQYLICLPASAPTQRGGASAGSSTEP